MSIDIDNKVSTEYQSDNSHCEQCKVETNWKVKCRQCKQFYGTCIQCESNKYKKMEHNHCKTCVRNYRIDTLTQINY